MKRIFAGLILAVSIFANAAFGQPPTDRIFPEGFNAKADSSGTTTGRSRSATVFGDAVTTIGTNTARIGVVETSVTQALVPETLQTVTGRGASTTATLVLLQPDLSTTAIVGPVVAGNYPMISVKQGSLTYGAGTEFEDAEGVGAIAILYTNSTTGTVLTPGVTSHYDASGNLRSFFSDGSFQLFTGSTEVLMSEGKATFKNGTNPDYEGLGISIPGVVSADVAFITPGDGHFGYALYSRYGVFGGGRQLIGEPEGSIIFGHAGTASGGWFSGSTVGIAKTTTGTVWHGSRNSGDTTALGGTLASPALRTNTTETTVTGKLWSGAYQAPVVLKLDTSIRSVEGDTNNWAEFSFTVPAAEVVAGASIEFECRGTMAGFTVDNNNYEVQILVDGGTILNEVYTQNTIDPVNWYHKGTLTITSASAGRFHSEFAPHDPASTGYMLTDLQSDTWSGASGDLSFIIQIKREGTISAETATMNYSRAMLIRP